MVWYDRKSKTSKIIIKKPYKTRYKVSTLIIILSSLVLAILYGNKLYKELTRKPKNEVIKLEDQILDKTLNEVLSTTTPVEKTNLPQIDTEKINKELDSIDLQKVQVIEVQM